MATTEGTWRTAAIGPNARVSAVAATAATAQRGTTAAGVARRSMMMMAIRRGRKPAGSGSGRAPTNPRRRVVNEQIRAEQVRVIDGEGTNLGLKPRREALDLARAAGLDLVLFSDQGDAPVPHFVPFIFVPFRSCV